MVRWAELGSGLSSRSRCSLRKLAGRRKESQSEGSPTPVALVGAGAAGREAGGAAGGAGPSAALCPPLLAACRVTGAWRRPPHGAPARRDRDPEPELQPRRLSPASVSRWALFPEVLYVVQPEPWSALPRLTSKAMLSHASGRKGGLP